MEAVVEVEESNVLNLLSGTSFTIIYTSDSITPAP
jgi:hypothetical protein